MGKKANKKQKMSTARKIVYITAIVLAAAVISGAVWFNMMWEEMHKALNNGRNGGEHDQEMEEEDKKEIPDIMNLLILGLDSRDAIMRSDTIMLLSLNRNTDEITIFSIPRDMRVEIPGYGKEKINHAYAYGEVGLTKQAVENFLDIEVHHYLSTDFEGFVNIVDFLGGVEVEIEKRKRYYAADVTIELDPGQKVLDGDKALQYVRFRSDEDGDLGRVKRQQTVLRKLIQELLAFRNVFNIPRVMPELAENVKTDLDLNQAVDLAKRLRNVEVEEINTYTLPGNVGYVEGISYVLPIEEEIRELVDRYINQEKKQS